MNTYSFRRGSSATEWQFLLPASALYLELVPLGQDVIATTQLLIISWMHVYWLVKLTYLVGCFMNSTKVVDFAIDKTISPHQLIQPNTPMVVSNLNTTYVTILMYILLECARYTVHCHNIFSVPTYLTHNLLCSVFVPKKLKVLIYDSLTCMTIFWCAVHELKHARQ